MGPDNLVLLPNTLEKVETDKLDPNKGYMQICSVELYWTKEQLLERQSTFKQHFGIRMV